MWTKERLRMIKFKDQQPDEPEPLHLTAKELDEYEKLRHDTGLINGALRRAWLDRKLQQQRSM